MRRVIPFLALALVGVVSLARAETDVREQPFAFTTIEVRGDWGEPSIAFSARDHVFVCSPLGVPGGQMLFLRSADWKTFERKTISDRGAGGDCHVAVGADGAVYTTNLQAWGSAIRKSVDDGRTFDYVSSEDAVEQDRQWLATDPVDASIVYHAYHNFSGANEVVAKSLDGGRTWILHTIASTDPTLRQYQQREPSPGPIRIDPTNHLRLYMVWGIHDVSDCPSDPNCPFLRARRIVVARSDDGGLTWVNRIAMTAPPGSRLGALIPWISLDRAGNVYIAVAGWFADGATIRNGIFMASSSDRGENWSAPVKVDAGAGATVFPAIAAGADGIVDLAWISSTAATAGDTGTWTVHFAQSRNARDAAPVFTEITGPVVHNGGVCLNGVLCGIAGGGSSDRSLLDFMDIAIDSFGYAHLVVKSNVPREKLLYWRQDAGPSALGEPCAPVCVLVRPGPRP